MAEALMKSMNPKFRLCAPTDVRFWFKDADGAVKEVKAHSQILASASDVFYRQFYGSLKAENDVEIKDASQESFLAMIEYIYNKKLVFKDISLSFLASLYYLANKYNIEDLRDEIVASIPEHEVTKENVLEVGLLAEENVLHQELSEALYDAAAGFVKKVKGAVNDLCADGNEEHAEVIFKIINRSNKVIIRSRKVKSELCGNCQQATCLTGQPLTITNFVKGAKVTHPDIPGDNWALLNSENGHKFSLDSYVKSHGHLFNTISQCRYSESGFLFMCD